eukprot:10971409-Prorocentrum_lima.AAC.1
MIPGPFPSTQLYLGPDSLLTKQHVVSNQLPFKTPWWRPICHMSTSGPSRGDASCHIRSAFQGGPL